MGGAMTLRPFELIREQTRDPAESQRIVPPQLRDSPYGRMSHNA
jgi:hypothetical protein